MTELKDKKTKKTGCHPDEHDFEVTREGDGVRESKCLRCGCVKAEVVIK